LNPSLPSTNSSIARLVGGVLGDELTITVQCSFCDKSNEQVQKVIGGRSGCSCITPQGAPKMIAWRNKPSTYVVCLEDMAVHPDVQRIMARGCGL
jgi:hypothetical protein